MQAQIVTVGNELLLGRTIDSNAAWLAQRLDDRGFEVVRKTTVGDRTDLIVHAIQQALEESSVLIVTGGLGPTHDDRTRDAIADVFMAELHVDPELEASLAAMYERRGRRFTDERRTMALVPDGFEWLSNPIGSAPGLLKKVRQTHPKCLLALPGVPYEMRAIFEAHVEYAFDHLPQTGSAYRTFRTAGITENRLQEMLSSVIDALTDTVDVAFLPDPRDGVAVRVSSRAETDAGARALLEDLAIAVESAIGEYVYGGEDDRLEAVIGSMLTERGLTLSMAESCTGGLIGDRLTDVPGSSEYFKGGVVTYGNLSKMDLLGVDRDTLRKHGAVSGEVAEQMAAGCRDLLKTDMGLSVTGIAGPTGGTPEKPVGTVWIGLADVEKVVALKLQLTENRRLNKELAGMQALNLVRKRLKKLELTGQNS
jgi:nicotinamide-nucleotide amidase